MNEIAISAEAMPARSLSLPASCLKPRPSQISEAVMRLPDIFNIAQ
jgi:hypothetical protein